MDEETESTAQHYDCVARMFRPLHLLQTLIFGSELLQLFNLLQGKRGGQRLFKQTEAQIRVQL